MSQLVVYPGEKIELAVFEGQTETARVSFQYPECECDIGSMVTAVKETLGYDQTDIGITAYGMSENTCKKFLNLTPERVEKMCNEEFGNDPTNIGVVILASLGANTMVQAYPLTFGQLPPIAILSGLPQIQRKIVAHTFDHKMALQAHCQANGIGIEDIKAVTVYLSHAEVSCAGHVKGEIEDITDSYDGEGPMTPTRSGFFHQRCVYRMALSGKFKKDELFDKIRTNGGLKAHLGTCDLEEVRRRIKDGDQKAKTVYDAMVYQIAKHIGRMSISLKDKPQAIILAGPLTKDNILITEISEYISYIAPISIQSFDPVSKLNALACEIIKGIHVPA
jgi:butyrate kinase